MLIEKYMVIGITFHKNTVNDVIQNTSNIPNYGNSIIDFSIKLDVIKEYNNSYIKTDNKTFENKNDAINHILDLRYLPDYNTVMNWSVISIYEDITDILQIRKYKLKKLHTIIKNYS